MNLNLNKLIILFVLGILFSACSTRNFNRPIRNTNTNTTSTKKMSDFDRELKAMRTADFDYIFALRRKDGKVFDAEDKTFVKNNKHYAANRFILVDDDKVLFIGSNFEFSEENMKALNGRFDVENYSKPKEVLEKIKKEKEAANKQATENSNTKDNKK